MKNFILVVILLAIAIGVVLYIYRAKKQGQACIGCPHSKQCGGHCGSSCSCGCGDSGVNE